MKPRLEVSSKSNISAEIDSNNVTHIYSDAGHAVDLKMSDVKRLLKFLGKVVACRAKKLKRKV